MDRQILRLGDLCLGGRLASNWKTNLECRSLPGRTLDGHRAIMSEDDVPDNRQAQSSAAAAFARAILNAIKSLENMRLITIRNTDRYRKIRSRFSRPAAAP